MIEKKILVAGANGVNGRTLLAKLREKRIPVRAMVRNKNNASDLENETTELVEADFMDINSLFSVFRDIQQAYIAAPIHPDALTFFNNFFTIAKEVGVRHIIKLSGMGAARDSASEILRQHFLSDELLIHSGMSYTILRSNSFFQNIIAQKKSIQTKGRFGMQLGNACQSFVDIRDVADATEEILNDARHINKIYVITGPEAISGTDIASKLSMMLDKPVKYKPVSAQFAKQEMLIGGFDDWISTAIAEIQEQFATNAFDHISNDLERILNRKARALTDFIEDYQMLFYSSTPSERIGQNGMVL